MNYNRNQSPENTCDSTPFCYLEKPCEKLDIAHCLTTLINKTITPHTIKVIAFWIIKAQVAEGIAKRVEEAIPIQK